MIPESNSDLAIHSVFPVQEAYSPRQHFGPKYFWRVSVFGVTVGEFKKYSEANQKAADIRFALLGLLDGVRNDTAARVTQ